MERTLRKQQSLLVDAGSGVILFGIWGVAKMNLYLGLSPVFLEAMHQMAGEFELGEKFLTSALWPMITVFMAIGLIIRFYVGLSAVSEGKGKKKGCFYLVVAAALLATTLQHGWTMFSPEVLMAEGEIEWGMVLACCLELVSIYVILQLLISGFRVKILKKKLKG